ncbi:MAG: LTA synthase family protein [Lachnospiraceae bacterium]|nr:LTA synthase family protein [Lachnospiraceae bacterium]
MGSNEFDNNDSIEEFIDAEISSIQYVEAKVNNEATESNEASANQDTVKIEAGADNRDTTKPKFFDGIVYVPVRIAIFLALIVYEEMMFHFLSIGRNVSFLPVKLIMCVPTAVLLAILVMFLPKAVEKVWEGVLFGALVFYYGVNLLYHSAFQVYFSIKFIDSSNAKITQYYREIWNSIKINSWKLALVVLVPVIIYVLLRVFKRITYKRVSVRLVFVPIVFMAIMLTAEAAIVYSYGQDTFSPYNLIVAENVSDFSFPRLGVLATAEIELKNIVSPTQVEAEEEYEVWHYDPARITVNYGNSGTNINDGTGNISNSADGIEDIVQNVIDTSPNMLDIDFVALGEAETNTEVSSIHKYFASVEPTYKNQYTGMFEGYNLIFLTCEAFCPLAVDETLTPTLYKLVNEGFVFNNFYNPRTNGSTSDGEFVCSTGLVPTNGGASNFKIAGQNSMPFALGNMFNMKYGITSRAYHDNDYTYYDRDKTYPGMGYYYQGIGNGLEMSYNWPSSDLEMMQASVADYIDEDMFNVYYMTVSGHMNYNFGGNAMSLKHKAEVDDLPYSTACKAYLACQMELDAALEYLLAQLEEKGIADKTVICFTGDHWPYGLTNEEYSELLGHDVDPYFELYKSNLVLWSGSIKEPIVIDKYCCSMDILPTLLNLFGFEYDSRLLMGRDILSDTEGFVLCINRSFITDKVMYNSMNGQVIYLTDEELPEDYVSNAKNTLNNRYKYSQKIMDTDYYRYICEALGIEIPVVSQ